VSEGSAPTASQKAPDAPGKASSQADRTSGVIAGPGLSSRQENGAGYYADMNVPVIDGCLAFLQRPIPRGSMQFYAAGYSNAKKLNSALVAGYPVPALLKGEAVPFGQVLAPDGIRYQCGGAFELVIDHQGRQEFPPVRATFLAFGFMPVTATAHIGQMDGEPFTSTVFRPALAPPGLTQTTSPYSIFGMAKISLRLSDVTVNGVPLDVGGNCRTAGHLTSPDSPYRPDRVVLVGGSGPNDPRPKFSHILYGGATAGAVSIPNFTGCVTPGGEDITRLLDASVSGPGNFLKMNVGPACQGASFGDTCRSSTDLRPSRVPYYTVRNGGPFTATGGVTFEAAPIGRPLLTITCPSVDTSGAIPEASGPPRGDLGTLNMTFPHDCAGSDGSTWEVSMQGVGHMAGSRYIEDQRKLVGKVVDLSLRLTGRNIPGVAGSCWADIDGGVLLGYTNPPDVKFALEGPGEGVGARIADSTCPDVYFKGVNSANFGQFRMFADLDIQPTNITITSPPASEVAGP
ncbi:hypothetical protein ACFQ07_30300, partial [Actinomadura adrarensis]